MAQQFKNASYTKLASSVAEGDTSITVVDGSVFPSSFSSAFRITVVKTSSEREVMLVTGRSDNVLQVTRAQDGTQATAFGKNSIVSARLTTVGYDAGLMVQRAYRSYAGTPLGILTPEYIGEKVFDTFYRQWFVAVGAENTDWKTLTPAGAGGVDWTSYDSTKDTSDAASTGEFLGWATNMVVCGGYVFFIQAGDETEYYVGTISDGNISISEPAAISLPLQESSWPWVDAVCKLSETSILVIYTDESYMARACVVAVSGSTLTPSVSSLQLSTLSGNMSRAVALSSDKVVFCIADDGVAYAARVILLGVSGETISVLDTKDMTNAPYHKVCELCKTADGGFVASYMESDMGSMRQYVRAFTESGGSLAMGEQVELSYFSGNEPVFCSIAEVDDNVCVAIGSRKNEATLYARCITKSGVSLSLKPNRLFDNNSCNYDRFNDGGAVIKLSTNVMMVLYAGSLGPVYARVLVLSQDDFTFSAGNRYPMTAYATYSTGGVLFDESKLISCGDAATGHVMMGLHTP